MTVKELIRYLQTVDENLTVRVQGKKCSFPATIQYLKQLDDFIPAHYIREFILIDALDEEIN